MQKLHPIAAAILGDANDALMDLIPVGIFICDPRGHCVYVNKFWCEITGLNPEEAAGENWVAALHPEDRHEHYQSWQEFVAGLGPYNSDARFLRHDNTVAWVRAKATMIRDAAGASIGVLGCVMDVSAVKSREIELERATDEAESEAKFNREIAATMPSLLWAYNLATCHFTYVTERVREMWGYTSAEIRAMGDEFLPRIIHPEDLALMIECTEKIQRAADREVVEVEFRVKHRSGKIMWNHARITVFRRDENGNPMETLGVTEDITAKKEALAALDAERTRSIYSAKMASLGEMAGGIAHEINNPLAIITGKAYQLRSAVIAGNLDPKQILATADKIEQTGFRISKIIQGLRAFSRNGEQDEFASASLREIIDDTLELCRQRFNSSGVRLDTKIDDMKLDCRAVQISQVILNMLNNAHDAVEKLEDRWVEIAAVPVGRTHVEITITDSGAGIPLELRERIMQPFFTTKKASRGTGLGLSISQAIVDDHDGELRVDETCANTRFRILLPLRQNHARSAA